MVFFVLICTNLFFRHTVCFC